MGMAFPFTPLFVRQGRTQSHRQFSVYQGSKGRIRYTDYYYEQDARPSPRASPSRLSSEQSNLLDLRSGSDSGAPAARAPHRALTRDSSNTFIYGRPARARAVPRRAPTTARHMICLLPFPSMQQHIVLIARCSTLPSVTKAHVPIKRTPHQPWSLASWYSLDPCPRPPDRPAASTGRLSSCLSCACAHTDSGRCAPWRRTCGSRRGGWSHRPRPA